MGSAVKLVDQRRAQPDLVVVGLAERDVLVNVEVAVRLPLVVQPDQRSFDDEEHLHRIRMVVCDQGVGLARRLVDEVARGRDPVVLEITPLARDRVGEDLVRMIVPVHQPGRLGHQDVAPFVQAGRDPQRPRRHGLGEGHVVALVVGRGVGGVDLRQGIGLEDLLDGFQVAPEFHPFLLLFQMCMPPSAITTLPVVKALLSEARNSTVSATSSALARRPSGIPESRNLPASVPSAWLSPLSTLRWKSLSIGPGATTFTRMRLDAASLATGRIRPISACLEAAEAAMPGSLLTPTTLDVMIMLAPSRILGSACLQARNEPLRFTATTASKMSSG